MTDLNTYTPKQRKALHLWCEQVAEVLNAAGHDQRVVLKESVEIPWDKLAVKERLYKPILEAYSGKTSTEDQSTVEPDKIVDFLAVNLGEKFQVVLPQWPDRSGQ